MLSSFLREYFLSVRIEQMFTFRGENTMDAILIMLAIINLVVVGLVAYLMIRNNDKNKENLKAIAGVEFKILRLEQMLQDEMRKNRVENNNTLNHFNESIVSRVNENNNNQLAQLDSFTKQLHQLTLMNENKFERLRDSVEGHLKALQQDNQKKLEEMRKTVDEKLHDTLEKRLGESFRLVSNSLEQVHKGLGEMQNLAVGVGDLKKVLSNVKTRGIWGEIQLGNLLEQILTPEQYAKNIATVPQSNERVEFAIKLPGKDEHNNCVWLPIDAKFPQEDYQRLIEAQENGNLEQVETCGKALEVRLKAEAKDISEKYVCVPSTTEFAILFLPIEGLYAEVLRRIGLCEILMNKYKVIIAGPTTLAALLNSLQMGFRTLAIEKRSAEVWNVLSAVKTEFSKFGDLLDRTHKKLQEASNSIDTAARKSRTIERKLKNVEKLPEQHAASLLDEVSDEEKE